MTDAPQPSRVGRKPSVPVSPDAMKTALGDLSSHPTIEVRTFAVLWGVSSQTAYAAARSGQFGAVRLGGQFRFPSAIVSDALGLPPPGAGATPSAEGSAP